MSDRTGKRLDDYQIIQQLGEGTFGDVYLARHLFEQKLVAIKLFKAQFTPDTLQSFVKEARTFFRLQHPHIVQLLDFDIHDQIPFLVMEYAPNGTLHQRHPPGIRVLPTTVLLYVQQLSDALQYAHEKRLIHRDVKPQNMLLRSANEVLLSDFGISTVAHSESSFRAQEMAGTIPYMAPEQIQGKPCPASDQYSLAVVVYEWLCGECPFQGAPWAVITQQLLAEPPSLREKIPTLSPAIERVVMRALSKDPQRRFADMRAFALALEYAVTESTPGAFPSPYSTLPAPSALASSPSQFRKEDPLSSLPPVNAFSTVRRHTPEEILPHHQTMMQATLPVTLPAPPAVELSTAPTRPLHSHNLSTRYIALLIVMVLLLIIGVRYAYSAVIPPSPTIQPTTLPRTTATAKAVIDPYDTAVTQHGIMFGFNAQHTGYNPYEHILNASNVSHLQLKWTATTKASINSTAAVVNGIVYFGSRDNNVYAYNAITGKLQWVAFTGEAIYSSPAVVNGVVYIGSLDRYLYAFDAVTGQRKWAAPTGAAIQDSPVVANGLVFVGSFDHFLYAFDEHTGQERWSAPTGDIIQSSPAVANGIVYVGAHDGRLYAFDAATGQLKWSAATGNEIQSPPTVANGLVYVGSYDHKLYAFDAISGREKWADLTGGDVQSSPAVANGLVYVGSWDHFLYAFDALTGKERWAAQTDNSIPGTPMVANGLVYAGSWDGRVYAFDATTGLLEWNAFAGGGIFPCPEVVNGMVYVGSRNFKFYAYSLP